MTANQIPYDAIDWLQIAIYFLALPVVAFLSAAIGLLGRTRRGGMLWSTTVGLLGGTVACLVCILAITTLDQKLPSSFVAYFEGNYRWLMLIAALAATGGCAVAAGIAWRITHPRREVQPFSFSLSQLLLIQLFAFLSLGAWIGFRIYVLSAVSPGEYQWRALNETVARWSSVGWNLEPNRHTNAEIDIKGMSADEIAEAMSRFNTKDLTHLPNLGSVTIKLVDDNGLDLAPILQQPNIRGISLEFGAISDRLLKQLATSEIESLALFGNLSERDLGMLAKMPKLKRLVLFGACSRASISSLGDSKSLKDLLIYDAYLSRQGTSEITWPTSLESLLIGDEKAVPFDPRALSRIPELKSLSLYGPTLIESEIAFLKTLPVTERLDLTIASPTAGIANQLANLPINMSESGLLSLNILDSEFTQEEATLLRPIKNLRFLHLRFAGHGDEILEELAKFPMLERIETSSPKVTLEGLWKLADMPKLNWLYYPKTLNSAEFNHKFREHRKSIAGPMNIDGSLTPIVRDPSASSSKP